MRLEVDSGGYVDACSEFYDANHGVNDVISTLASALAGTGGMAGTDTGGEEFAAQYDRAAGPLLTAGCQLGEAMASMANLLNASLVNHEGADHAARVASSPTASAPTGDDDPDHYGETLSVPTPPSAAGGTGDQPGWWHWIASHVQGLLWPDADTGRLRSAGTAWTTAAGNLANWSPVVESASAQISAQTSPEVADATAACTQLVGHISDLSSAFTEIGSACTEYADHVDAHHREVEGELASFIEWTVAIEVGGGLLAVVTAGISEAAAQAAEAAEVANAAQKVIRILNDLIELARLGVARIGRAVEGVAEIGTRLEGLLSARVVKAVEEAGEVIARSAPEDLGALEGSGALTEKELEAIGFYTGPGYEGMNAYLRGISRAVENGTATPAELEAYSKAVSEGLSKLPTYTGETLRGTNLPDSVLAEIDRTGTFSDPAFMSSSTSAEVAQDFRGSGNAMLHLSGSSGHDVQALSQYGHEAEVLYDKGTHFDVVRKVWNDKGYWDIYLEETP